jgi:hypothetical protein
MGILDVRVIAAAYAACTFVEDVVVTLLGSFPRLSGR